MPFKLPEPTELAVPAFVFLVLVEIVYARLTGKAKYESRDTATSLIMGLGSTIAGALATGFLAFTAYFVWENFRIFDIGYAWWVFALAFVLDDLAYYWIHRFSHRMRWMWAAHVIHHSSQHYNLSTALRQTWTGSLTPLFLFRMPIFLIGIEPAIVFFCKGINLIYQFWIHTEAIKRMPRWFEAIFNTPSHHRVHHGNNPKYLDANYAGVFIIWDRIFGTFIPEDDKEPVRYGLVYDLGTFNPLRVAIHEWIGIFKDMWNTKSWVHKIQFLIMPPGWTPDGSRKTSEMIKQEWLERQERLKSATDITDEKAPIEHTSTVKTGT